MWLPHTPESFRAGWLRNVQQQPLNISDCKSIKHTKNDTCIWIDNLCQIRLIVKYQCNALIKRIWYVYWEMKTPVISVTTFLYSGESNTLARYTPLPGLSTIYLLLPPFTDKCCIWLQSRPSRTQVLCWNTALTHLRLNLPTLQPNVAFISERRKYLLLSITHQRSWYK